MSRLQFKEIDQLTFYRKPYSNVWVISGIDICKELGYKNPYEQAYKIYKRYEENFKDTSFLIPVLKYKKEIKTTPHDGRCFLDKNHTEIRCYNRPGLWFFTSKCNIPKANKLIERLFKKFDKLIDDLNKIKTQEWQIARQKGKEIRHMATDGLQYLKEYQVDHGSKNTDKVYTNYTLMIDKKVSGLKKLPLNWRDTASKRELEEVALLESLLTPWLEKCIERRIEYHEIYQLIKKEIDIRLTLIRQMLNKDLCIP